MSTNVFENALKLIGVDGDLLFIITKRAKYLVVYVYTCHKLCGKSPQNILLKVEVEVILIILV